MGRIIVGMDESPSAADALRWAVAEGEHRGWPLTAVMAWGYLDQRHADDARFDPDYGPDDAAHTLVRLVERAAPDVAASIECRAVCDLPARALLEQSAGADLLVVGARGHGGFRGLLLGSVSQRCAQHTAIPLAIVRTDATEAVTKRIVVGVDGSKSSHKALSWALDEARARHAQLTVVHAWIPAMFGAIEFAAPVLGIETFEATAKRTVDEALAESDVDGLAGSVDTAIVEGGAARAILHAAEDASLIVVGSHGRGAVAGMLLGSVSQQVIHHAGCPVVVVPV
jgi:nucleotide-binding universal stress UspA family protein